MIGLKVKLSIVQHYLFSFRHVLWKCFLPLRNDQFLSTDSYNHFHAIARAKQHATEYHYVQM